MTISSQKTDDELALLLSGRLDSATSGDLTDYLEKNFTQEVKRLILDFSEVDFISSRGLRVLVTVYKALNGREMEIRNANTSVKEVLQLSGLLKIFNVK